MNTMPIVEWRAGTDQRKIVTDMLSEFLSALGFQAMADAVKTEADVQRIRRYARIVVKNTKDDKARLQIVRRFQLLNLI